MTVLAGGTALILFRGHYCEVAIAVVLEHAILIGLLPCYALFLSPSISYWWPGAASAGAFLCQQYFNSVWFFLMAALLMQSGFRSREEREQANLI
jgi:hypothetical protein